VTLMTLLPSSIEGLMGLWEEQPVSLLKGLELGDESSLFMWGSSGAPYCPPNERCIPRIDGGNDEPLGREPSPLRGGETSAFQSS